jgi:hypothetical protein
VLALNGRFDKLNDHLALRKYRSLSLPKCYLTKVSKNYPSDALPIQWPIHNRLTEVLDDDFCIDYALLRTGWS